MNPVLGSRRRLIVTLAAAAVLVALVVLFSQAFLPRIIPFAGLSPTTNTDLVSVTLVDPRTPARKTWPQLRIPQSYMTDPSHRRGGKQERVRIEAAVPPPTPPAANSGGAIPAQRMAGAVVNLEAAAEGARNLSGLWSSMSGAGGEQRGYVARDPLHGLKRIHEVPCMRSGAQQPQAGSACDADRPVREYFFALDSRGDALASFSCMPPWSAADGGCQALLFHEGVKIGIIFRRSDLQRWSDYVDGSKALVDRFLVRSGKT